MNHHDRDDDRTHHPLSLPDEPLDAERVTGVGTDGSLESADRVEPDVESGVDSGGVGPASGVGTDGSLRHDNVEHDH